MLRWCSVLRAFLASLLRRRTDAEQVAADVRFHLEQAEAEYRDAGLSSADARRAALVAFGSPTRVIEDVREQSLWRWWEGLAQDLRYGCRGCRRSPVFAATAVLSLALGIGANAAIFAVMAAALLRPLPVGHPEQLAVISSPRIGDFTYQDYLALRASSRLFSDVVAASRPRKVAVGAGIDTDPVPVKIVSGNYFTGLGIQPAIGRVFAIGDELDPVAVISHGYWRRRFGGSPAILGQQLRVDGVALAIVGVAPAGFFGEAPGEGPDLWASVALQPPDVRTAPGFSWLNLLGRLRPGVSLGQAASEVETIMARLHPGASPDAAAFRQVALSAGARGLANLRTRFGDPLRILMAIVALVLLVACTNLGTLLVARGAARADEIATRLAIGASRARIVRQLLTESLLLSALGGALGLLFALWGSGALVRMVSSGGGGLTLDVGLDRQVLIFTIAISLAAAALFGTIPAVRAVRHGAASLAVGAHRAVGRERRWSPRDAFLIAQAALSVMLLTASALFIRTLQNLETQDLGFRLENRLQVQIGRERGYRPAIAVLVPELLARVRAIPGVEAASVSLNGPLSDSGSGVNGLQVEGYVAKDPQDARARADWVGPDYFTTAGIALVAGRDFTSADAPGAERVAIVNETMAQHYFGGGAAVGRRFRFNKNEFEIVAVATDARYADLREPQPRVVYFPVIQMPAGFSTVEIRTSAPDPTTVAAAVRSAIHDTDPRLSAGGIMTLAERVDRKLFRERLVASLAGFFGALTLVLVSIGVYGTLAYAAAQRTREIGVRLALGSRRGAVIWIMTRDVIARLAIGGALGLAGVLAGGRLVGSLLYGLQPTDPGSIAGALVFLSVAALMAGIVPSFRASRLDPASILRE